MLDNFIVAIRYNMLVVAIRRVWSARVRAPDVCAVLKYCEYWIEPFFSLLFKARAEIKSKFCFLPVAIWFICCLSGPRPGLRRRAEGFEEARDGGGVEREGFGWWARQAPNFQAACVVASGDRVRLAQAFGMVDGQAVFSVGVARHRVSAFARVEVPQPQARVVAHAQSLGATRKSCARPHASEAAVESSDALGCEVFGLFLAARQQPQSKVACCIAAQSASCTVFRPHESVHAIDITFVALKLTMWLCWLFGGGFTV